MSDVTTEGRRPWTWESLLVEPRRPLLIREQPNAHWFAVGAVCVGALIGQLDASIVTVALPTLSRTFGASVGAVTWVGLAYLLVLVATVTAVGHFADMWGRKLLYVYGFVVFIAASAACGLAPDLALLCIFRALQAVGAAMLQANSLAIIVLCVPQRSLGRAIGLQGAAQALGLAIGPTVGGVLLAAGGWRWIFFVNVPIGLVGAVAALLLVPRSQNLAERVPFDWRGLGLFFPTVVALLSALSFGATEGWASPVIVGCFAAAVVLGVVFVRLERRTAEPMLAFSMFANRRFTVGVASAVCSYLVMFGILLLLPFYLEGALKLGTGRTGLELMAMPLAFGLVAPFAGRLADRTGARPLTVLGMALTACGLMGAGLERPDAPWLVGLLAVMGVGLGLFTSPNNAAVMGTAHDHRAGMASGVLNMSRGLGTSLGLAITGLVFTVAGGSKAHAFTVTAVVLGAVAVLAGVLSGLRSSGALADATLASIE